MTEVVVRKMPFEFDAGVPFLWQPANPAFSIFCNAFTFIAVPFEKYIIKALRSASDRLNSDPAVAEEADVFLRQEAQHASAHRKHMLALIERYPALEGCYQATVRHYDDLIATHPVEFHAAYIANLEATFTPLFKVFLENRHSLFDGGDGRVASLMTWHFVEEIEHRSSGLILYQHLMSDPWYRVRHVRHTFRHVSSMWLKIVRTFDAVVPFEERGGIRAEAMTSALLPTELKYRAPGARWRRARSDGPPSMLTGVPNGDLARMIWRLLLSQSPYHDPADQPLPEWAGTWMREYDRGTDMTAYFTGR